MGVQWVVVREGPIVRNLLVVWLLSRQATRRPPPRERLANRGKLDLPQAAGTATTTVRNKLVGRAMNVHHRHNTGQDTWFHRQATRHRSNRRDAVGQLRGKAVAEHPPVGHSRGINTT